ncbi:glycosyltransferase [Nodosilinea sp. E11]|uniref:glycosyltransferase n=1 Tax=Nodosilinea sp. E11 TaxID=3037479 RepID=UPI002934F8CF|nr:glycosyltransferase [Nodosilinea sp. E11]WOD41519.1 glycosyltransferase [Nodosilinea sp. E11]
MNILLTADPELPVPPTLYGGIERIIDLLIEGLRQRGHRVGLVAHRDSTCAVDAFYPWPGLSSASASDTLRNTAALWQAAQQFQPDVLHSFSRLQYLLPLLPTALPKVMSYQRQPTERTVRWAAKLAGRSLTFTGCSEHICRQGRAAGGQWHPIHNCVQLEKFTFQPRVAEDAPLVFLSRLDPIKGAHNAIAAAQHTNRRLLIAGNQVESPEGRAYWESQIAPHLGKDGIEYVGPVDDRQKNELLGQAAAMVVPIEWDEPFGIVFAEALACGTPVISTPRGSLPEIVRPGVDGFLVNPVDEVVVAIQQLPAINRRHCRQRVESHFSAEAVVSQYEKLYQVQCRAGATAIPLSANAIANTRPPSWE